MQALHSFRDNKSSLLIATPQAARGLDLPAVSHVYNLGPPEDPVEYLHRAGRAGRIGSPVGGMAPLSQLFLPSELLCICVALHGTPAWQGLGLCQVRMHCQRRGQLLEPPFAWDMSHIPCSLWVTSHSRHS